MISAMDGIMNMVDATSLMHIDDRLSVVDIEFGDDDNTKVFYHAWNDEYVSMIILENVYKKVESGGQIKGLPELIRSSFQDGAAKPYMAFTFPNSSKGLKALEAVTGSFDLIKDIILLNEEND